MSLARVFLFCASATLVACGGGDEVAHTEESAGPVPRLLIDGVEVIGSSNEPMTVTVDGQPDEDAAPQRFQVQRPLSVDGTTSEPLEVRLDYADEAGNGAQQLIYVTIE